MATKPSIPQGTRDFSPVVVRKRQYILGTLKTIFERYGFQPLETPAMENLTTLTGKYGEEGDRLIFKVLNNGLHEKKDKKREELDEEWAKMLEKPYTTPVVTERALRYDLTIPFARFVVMNQNDLAFPFRRYQMQPVWRADRPQKGRYREFWQCDADVVGSQSLINEAELLCIYQGAFDKLRIPQLSIKINSRKLLAGLADICGTPDKMMELTIALDKLDKIGWDKVAIELADRSISQEGIAKVKDVIAITGDNEQKLQQLEAFMSSTEIGKEGIAELRTTLAYYKKIKEDDWGGEVVVDISLARGLNYYTGVIVEVTSDAVKMGSIGGGGRYDDLTGLFGLKNMTGVGVSFGVDRIYDVMEELELFPDELSIGIEAMLVNFGGESEQYALEALKQIRGSGVNAELYPDAVKFDKQMKYANKRGVPYVIIAGEQEMKDEMYGLKNFITGEQQSMNLDSIIALLKD